MEKSKSNSPSYAKIGVDAIRSNPVPRASVFLVPDLGVKFGTVGGAAKVPDELCGVVARGSSTYLIISQSVKP